MLYTTTYSHESLGKITIACSDEGIVGLWLDGQRYFKYGIDEALETNPTHPLLQRTTKWLDDYFSNKKPDASELPLEPRGSRFAKDVWGELVKIGYGELSTYGNIAKKVATKNNKSTWSARATGGAVGHNPISIIVPCHRVIGANGNLTGYGGGIKRKIWLLEHEGVDVSKLIVPTKGTAI